MLTLHLNKSDLWIGYMLWCVPWCQHKSLIFLILHCRKALTTIIFYDVRYESQRSSTKRSQAMHVNGDCVRDLKWQMCIHYIAILFPICFVFLTFFELFNSAPNRNLVTALLTHVAEIVWYLSRYMHHYPPRTRDPLGCAGRNCVQYSRTCGPFFRYAVS